MKKLWMGRTDADVFPAASAFNSSIATDSRMYRQDIDGSIAHAAMLGHTGIISSGDADAIITGLLQIKQDIDSGALAIDPDSEDIHTFIELTLTDRIGEAGKRLHTGRSRNDQVALDLRLYLNEQYNIQKELLAGLIQILTDLAEEHDETIMPGYTHLQRAQPVTFGHYLLAYAAMFLRDIGRLEDARVRLLHSPLGAGALAGTSYPVDRQMPAAALAFPEVCINSIDAVSDRDFVLETAFWLSMVMTHLSRLCEEIIMFSSREFDFIELSEAYSTGSSIMPQKKNPDIAELIRGKTGRVFGALTALLTMIKGLPLAYNKDMQEDKELIFDALDTVACCLPLMQGMLATMNPNKESMRRAAAEGFLNATDCADYLTKKGLPFREAYKIVGELVSHAQQAEKTLEDLSLTELKTFCSLFEDDVYTSISLEQCVRARNSQGGTSPESVRKQIIKIRDELYDE